MPGRRGAGWRLSRVWTPGAQPFVELPPEAGLPEEGTAHFVVQLRYRNLLRRAGHRDASGLNLCVTEALRPYDAGGLVFGTEDLTVQPRSSLDLACDDVIPPELSGRTLFEALPHMHASGRRIATTLTPARGGEPLDLGSSVPYRVEHQHWIPIHASANEGDLVETRCSWDSRGAGPLVFGEGPKDETCWSFTMCSPRVDAAGLGWDLPSRQTRCRALP